MKKSKFDFIELRRFPTNVEFEQWLDGEKETWTSRKKHKGIRFDTEWMDCRYARRQGNNCQALLKIEKNNETGIIRILQSGDHQHEIEATSGFSGDERNFMRARSKMTAGQIQDSFLMQMGRAPKLVQIQNFQQQEKTKLGYNAPISVQEIQQYVRENLNIPADQNAPFLAKSTIDAADKFCLVWTTTKLLIMQEKHENINIDATYKILSYGFPILRVGTTDADGKFFPIALAIASNEDSWAYEQFFSAISAPSVLMADAAKAITKAQKQIWPESLRATCFFHVIKGLKEKFAGRPLMAVGEQILEEVRILQKAACNEEFEAAARVLNNEWARRYRERLDVLEILHGFVNFYIKDPANNGWFSGHNQFGNTNNSLERANREFKDREFGRRRVPIREFFQIAADAVHKWSINPDLQIPIRKPEIKFGLYQQAFELKKEGRMIIKIKQDERYLIPSKTGAADFETSDQLLAAYEQLYDDGNGGKNEPIYSDWESYVQLRVKFHLIYEVNVWDKDFYLCTCWEGSRMKHCKHSVLMMCEKQKAAFPEEFTADFIEPKRRRGRPKKTKKGTALIRD